MYQVPNPIFYLFPFGGKKGFPVEGQFRIPHHVGKIIHRLTGSRRKHTADPARQVDMIEDILQIPERGGIGVLATEKIDFRRKNLDTGKITRLNTNHTTACQRFSYLFRHIPDRLRTICYDKYIF